MATVISHLPPIDDLWSPTGGFDFSMEDMPSELNLWRRWSTRANDTMDPSPKKQSIIRLSISADSGCGSCGVADFELRCRSCGTVSVLYLDENQQPVLPAHACPPLATSSRPSTSSELAQQADSDASDATSLFSTPSFVSERDATLAPTETVGSAVSPRTARPAAAKTSVEQVAGSTLIGLPPSADGAASSPRTMASRAVPDWVAKSDCPVSTAMAAVFEEETMRNGKTIVPELPIAMDDSNISERDFAMRSRSSTVSSMSRSIRRKAVRPAPRWAPSEGASSSTAAPSEYQSATPLQAPVVSLIDAVEMSQPPPQLQDVSVAVSQIETPTTEIPASSSALSINTAPASNEPKKVSSVQELVKELTLSPAECHFPSAADLTYASLAPLPPSPSRSSVYSTDSWTEDEDFETPLERIAQIGNAIPYVPYRSEPLPTPKLRTPESRSLSISSSRSPRSPLPSNSAETPERKPVNQQNKIEEEKLEASNPQPQNSAPATTTTPAVSTPHLASQRQATAQPASATQKKWFERPQGPSEMKFKFVLTPRNGAKSSAGGKKSYVLPQADEDGRIIEPSSSAATKSSSSETKNAKSTSSSSSEPKKADDGSSGPSTTSSSSSAGALASQQGGGGGGVTLAQLARDPSELQRLLACTMFLLNDVPDKDAAPKRLDLGLVPGRSATGGSGGGGYAMKHQHVTEHEKEGMAAGVKNVKWRVSMRG